MSRFEQAVRLLGAGLLALVLLLPQIGSVSAHAVPERAYPEMNTAVPVMPALIEVLKLDGTKVDIGNTTLDLQDPNRSLVTVGVHPGLDNGAYVVQWTSVSAI